jgi:hypothetical protein
MPNADVPAIAGGMPKFDRASIMKAAWRHYRTMFARPGYPHTFSRTNFAYCLRCAWQRAHEAQMSPQERRAESIRAEIDSLKYKSFQINVEPTRQRLERELAALA